MKKIDQSFELQNLLISTDNERPRFSFLVSSKGPDTGTKSVEHQIKNKDDSVIHQFKSWLDFHKLCNLRKITQSA